MVGEEKRNWLTRVDLERKGDFYETRQNEFRGVPLSFLRAEVSKIVGWDNGGRIEERCSRFSWKGWGEKFRRCVGFARTNFNFRTRILYSRV